LKPPPSRCILTIEDPIEFLFPHRQSLVDQREVNIDTRSFGDALRNAMRAAPDVIMIGEIRDEETARHAIAYAETGHLCVSTMHANNADQAIERIINFFSEQAQKQLLMDLSLNLQGVISQKGRVDEMKEVMSKGDDVGMHTFDQSLCDLYATRRVTLKDALQYADSHADLALRVRLADRHPAADTPALTVNDRQDAHAARG